MSVKVVDGDLLDLPVEAIVNAWNRNTIPWWLLLPQGVSGAIKRRAGLAPFIEVARYGRLALGQAVLTSAGRLPFRGIIHVAGIDDLWRGSELATRLSTTNAIALAQREGFASIAIPLIGSGGIGLSPARSEAVIREVAEESAGALDVWIVRWNRA